MNEAAAMRAAARASFWRLFLLDCISLAIRRPVRKVSCRCLLKSSLPVAARVVSRHAFGSLLGRLGGKSRFSWNTY